MLIQRIKSHTVYLHELRHLEGRNVAPFCNAHGSTILRPRLQCERFSRLLGVRINKYLSFARLFCPVWWLHITPSSSLLLSAKPNGHSASSAYHLSQQASNSPFNNSIKIAAGPAETYFVKPLDSTVQQPIGRGLASWGEMGAHVVWHNHHSLLELPREAKLLNSLSCLMGMLSVTEERICK